MFIFLLSFSLCWNTLIHLTMFIFCFSFIFCWKLKHIKTVKMKGRAFFASFKLLRPIDSLFICSFFLSVCWHYLFSIFLVFPSCYKFTFVVFYLSFMFVCDYTISVSLIFLSTKLGTSLIEVTYIIIHYTQLKPTLYLSF